jgi:DNA repair photolyase
VTRGRCETRAVGDDLDARFDYDRRVDPAAHLASLLAPWKVGDEVVEGVWLEGVSTELGVRFRFRAGTERLAVDVAPIEKSPRFAARSAHFAFGYRTEGGRSPVDGLLGKRLCEAVAARSAENESRVLASLRAGADEADATRIRSVEVETLLEDAGAEGAPYYTLSPYVGCLVGCRFCYAQTSVGGLRSLLGRREVPWGSYVDVRRNAADVLARELADPRRVVRPLKFCPIVSDPYQAVERTERITRACLETIARADRVWPTLLLTRSRAIVEDLERIRALSRAWVGVSLPTVDDAVRRHFEPRAASVSERLEVLRTFRDAGVSTFVVVQPLFEGSVEAHADAIAAHATSASIDVLRGVEGAGVEFSAPAHAHTEADAWQRARAHALSDALRDRGVTVWTGELPPGWETSA